MHPVQSEKTWQGFTTQTKELFQGHIAKWLELMKQKDRTKQDQSGIAFLKLGWAKMNCPQSCNLSLLFHFFFLPLDLIFHNLGQDFATKRNLQSIQNCRGIVGARMIVASGLKLELPFDFLFYFYFVVLSIFWRSGLLTGSECLGMLCFGKYGRTKKDCISWNKRFKINSDWLTMTKTVTKMQYLLTGIRFTSEVRYH